MARNPLMPTALAVLQHNDQHFPEYRVDLYESIPDWLAAAREDKEGVAGRRSVPARSGESGRAVYGNSGKSRAKPGCRRRRVAWGCWAQ